MKIKLMLSLSLIVTLILGSCASSNEVTGGTFLQKRKYTKGVYFKNNGDLNGASAKNENEELDIFKTEELKSKTHITSATAVSENTNETQEMVGEEIKGSTMELENSSVSDAISIDESTGTISKTTIDEEKTAEVRIVEKQLSTKNSAKHKRSNAPASDVGLILLVILALLIPPLAVFLFEGSTQRFWIDLILALVGYGVGFWLLGGLGWICALVSVIYALLIVLEVI
jgi:uncharacterized membrane protein YqaE (UPF0057 family)